MSTNELHRPGGSIVSEARHEWTFGRKQTAQWRRLRPELHWVSVSRERGYSEARGVAPTHVLRQLNEQLEQHYLRREDGESGPDLDAEIERLEMLAATLIKARANVRIEQVGHAIDAAVERAERLLARP